MRKKTTASDVLRFLKEKGLLAAFERAFKEQRGIRIHWSETFSPYFKFPTNGSYMNYFTSLTGEKYFFQFAFEWAKTCEGENFWRNIDTIWKQQHLI